MEKLPRAFDNLSRKYRSISVPMRLQSATEFLVTYGWAILVIALITLAIFVSGIFNQNAYHAQQCVIVRGSHASAISWAATGRSS